MNTKSIVRFIAAIYISVLTVGIGAEWSIGIYEGESPVSLAPRVGAANPVLTAEDVTDVPAEFVADPFIIHEDDSWYMFFEVLDTTDGLGKIAYATSEDGIEWSYENIILSPGYHMSYPYVFKWNDDYYMIPETCNINAITLYKATNFPDEWTQTHTLVSGRRYADSSIAYYGNKWWLFSSTWDDLYLFYSDTLTGPWTWHPLNPIFADNDYKARQGGRVIVNNDLLIRYAQKIYPEYGNQVNAFKIVDISTSTYHELPVDENPIVMGSGYGWNEEGMHHVDPYLMENGLWIASVDGDGDPLGSAGVPRENWELIFVDSEETLAENGVAINAFDGDDTSFWHTEWSVYPGNELDPPHPHEIEIELDGMFQVEGLSYLPRQDGIVDGGVKEYEFYVSQDGIAWDEPLVAGTFDGSSDRKFITFGPAIGEFVKFKALSEVNDNPWTSVAEITLLGSPAPTQFNLAPNGIIVQPEHNVGIRIGEELEFAGMGEDPDGNYPLSYHWQFGVDSGIPDMYVQDPGLIQFAQEGTFNVSLTVTDALSLADSSPDVRTVRVAIKGKGR